jgi:hypothetical protein
VAEEEDKGEAIEVAAIIAEDAVEDEDEVTTTPVLE